MLDKEKPCTLIALPDLGVREGNRAALEYRREHPDLKSALKAKKELPPGYSLPMIEQNGNSTTAHGRLILTVLGGLAEFERELIRARTGEGRARAVVNGVKMGSCLPMIVPLPVRNCTRDAGRPFEVANEVLNSSYRKLAAIVKRW